jgi:large exoprotein involved in heme utilization and adhesion
LNLTEGSSLSAGTTGAAPGGNLTIQPNENGQTLAVNFSGGSTASAATSGSGKGGTLIVTAPESLTLSGNGSLISAETTGSGIGGNLTLSTGKLTVQDGAQVTVSSTKGGTAGSLSIEADSIRLNNRAKITADTTGGGGNIFLRSPFVFLRNQSAITTNATGEDIPGGNITIDAQNGYIIAVPEENSDISANSTDFRGGNVIINAQGVFGIQFQNAPTPKSDITATGASPQFNGTVEVNTPDVDPNQGLVNLPTVPIDTEVAQGCTAGGTVAKSEFNIIGRGGLPPNPGEALNTDAVQVDLITLNSEVAPKSTTASPTQNSIIEAQNWVIDAKGNVTLTANAPHTSSCQR